MYRKRAKLDGCESAMARKSGRSRAQFCRLREDDFTMRGDGGLL